jgi:alpha-glucosidase
MTVRSTPALVVPQADPQSRAAPLEARAWHRGALIYQVYPRSFLDTNADGIGDLKGIVSSLDYIAALGVDAIWVCPFFTSPMKDFGYDISDYRGVDPMFGTLADFDALIAAAHERGLKVMIDQVWSHSSDQHPWFGESRGDGLSAKADWYVWADPKADGSPPNNWLSVFGGPAWTWEPRRRQYYLHHFLPSQPQLNLRNPDVVAALLDIGRFWLDRGVDGFRLDAIDFMFHDPLLRDNPPRALANGALPLRPFGMQEHRHDMMHPDLLGFFARLRALLAEYPGAVTLGEISSEPGAFDRGADYTDRNAPRLDMAYTLGLMKRQLTVADFAQLLREAERAIAEGCLCWAFSNHDVVRAATRWGNGKGGPALSRLLIALLLSLPGAACMYQGEELGLAEADVPHELMVDPYGLAFYPSFKGRDGARTPMPWDGGAAAAGFSAAKPWLPVDPLHHDQAINRQAVDPASVLNFARRFIRWRKTQSALVLGNAKVLEFGDQVFGLQRSGDGQRILALFNLTDRPATVSMPTDCAQLIGHGFEARLEDGSVVLPPYGAFFARVI